MSLNCQISNQNKIAFHKTNKFMGPHMDFILFEQIAQFKNLYDLISLEEMYQHFVSVKSQEIDYLNDDEYNKLLDAIEIRDAISTKIIRININLEKKKYLEHAIKRQLKEHEPLQIQDRPQCSKRIKMPKINSFSSMNSNTPRNINLMFDCI